MHRIGEKPAVLRSTSQPEARPEWASLGPNRSEAAFRRRSREARACGGRPSPTLMRRPVDSRCVLAARDLPASSRFYADVLGFEQEFARRLLRRLRLLKDRS